MNNFCYLNFFEAWVIAGGIETFCFAFFLGIYFSSADVCCKDWNVMRYEFSYYAEIRRIGFSIHTDKPGFTIFLHKYYFDLRLR